MLTFTFRHARSDPLRRLLDSGRTAWEYFKSGRFWSDLSARYGILGTLRAEEITWSQRAGWHVHYHVMIVFDHDLLPSERASLQDESRERWLAILPRFGLSALRSIGVRFTYSQSSAFYAAKVQGWGIAEEVAYHRSKLSRRGSLVPFQILARAASDGGMRALWREYVEAVRGRRQLVSSRGLKALLGIDFDADVPLDEDHGSVVAAQLMLAEYALVCELGWRAVILDAAESCPGALAAYLNFVRLYAHILVYGHVRDPAVLAAFPAQIPENGYRIALDSSLAA
jgi:hypothetical protein